MAPQRRLREPTTTVKNDNRGDQGTRAATESLDYSTLEPKFGGNYLIELCSGELGRWHYLWPDEQSHVWWRDMETGLKFSEPSVIYAWRILGNENSEPEQANSLSLVQGHACRSSE